MMEFLSSCEVELPCSAPEASFLLREPPGQAQDTCGYVKLGPWP